MVDQIQITVIATGFDDNPIKNKSTMTQKTGIFGNKKEVEPEELRRKEVPMEDLDIPIFLRKRDKR
jgi:hypothetical protein